MSDEELEEEVKMLREQLNCPTVGMYGMGEVGGKEGEMCTFKNQTVTGFAVMEKEE